MNYALIDVYLYRKGLDKKDLAKALGIHPHTLYLKFKLDSGYYFNQKEIMIIRDLLEINNEDLLEIFLTK